MAGSRRICPTCGAAYGHEALFCPADGSPLAARPQGSSGDPHLGVEIAGLRLERLVGIGSMGRVYRAWQPGIERAVAVKILHRELMTKDTIVARFAREGRVAGGLAHPGVIAIHDSGNLPATGDGAGEPYLVMEFLDGLSLRSALAAAGGPLSLPRALHVVLQMCDAMGEAHAHGVVHRDLKPENVMLVQRGADPDFVKVVDFGVARMGDADSSLATHAGALLGTATYACPESARGERVGLPGDVYSIATVLFECLAGAPPFQGKSPVDLLIQHAQSDPPDVRARSRQVVPEPIAKVVARNLSKAEGHRAKDARELGRELLAAARESGFSSDAVPSGATLQGPAATATRTVRLATALVGAAWLAFAVPARAEQVNGVPAPSPPATAAPGGGTRTPVTKGIKVAPESTGAPRGDAASPGPVEPEPGEPEPPAGPPSAGATPPPVTEPNPAPLAVRHAEEEAERETRGQIELGVGFLTLPGAEVCVASFAPGCAKTDSSLALSAWPIFRRGRFAIGAGVMVGITATAEATVAQAEDIPRDHTRRYYSAEITGRYYVPLSQRLEGWVGVTTGLGVVNDTFQSQKGLTEKAVPGPRGVTLLTEGFTLGVGVGLSHQLSENWRFGGGIRVASWFLPEKPAVDPLGDRASLTGSVAVVDLGITLAYRSRLAF